MSDRLVIPGPALQQFRMLKAGAVYDAAVTIDGRPYVIRGTGVAGGGVEMLYPIPARRYQARKAVGIDAWSEQGKSLDRAEDE